MSQFRPIVTIQMLKLYTVRWFSRPWVTQSRKSRHTTKIKKVT